MSGSPVRRSDAPDASQSEICKQLARVVLDFAKPVYLTQPANRGIGIIVYKDPRNSRVDVPEYDLMVTESRAVWKSNRSDSAPRTRESHNVASIVVDSSMARERMVDAIDFRTGRRSGCGPRSATKRRRTSLLWN